MLSNHGISVGVLRSRGPQQRVAWSRAQRLKEAASNKDLCLTSCPAMYFLEKYAHLNFCFSSIMKTGIAVCPSVWKYSMFPSLFPRTTWSSFSASACWISPSNDLVSDQCHSQMKLTLNLGGFQKEMKTSVCCFTGTLGRTESLMLPMLLACEMLLTFQELSLKD